MIAFLLAAALTLPVRVSGDGFTVRAEAGMENVAAAVAEQVPGDLDAIYADLRGLPRPQTIEIRLVKQASSLQAVAPSGARVPEWAAGVAFPTRGIVIVAMRRGAHDLDLGNTTTHELAHMALGAALRGHAPRWLDEGFAYLHSSDFSWARTRTLTGMAWTGNRYFLYELEQRFPPGENAAGRAYAQAYDFVAYLAKRGRFVDKDDDGNREPFRQFLVRISDGRGLDNASIRAFGVPMDQLELEWWESVRKKYLWSLIGMSTLFVWCVGAVLLMWAWWKRRGQNKRRLAQWAEEESGLPDDGDDYAAAD